VYDYPNVSVKFLPNEIPVAGIYILYKGWILEAVFPETENHLYSLYVTGKKNIPI
jgi:hypothetical protein